MTALCLGYSLGINISKIRLKKCYANKTNLPKGLTIHLNSLGIPPIYLVIKLDTAL